MASEWQGWVRRTGVAAAIAAGCLAQAASAFGAPAVTITPPSESVEDASALVGLTGDAGTGARLITSVLAPGDGDCPPSPASLATRTDEVPAGAFALTVPFRPSTPGSHIICAWLVEPLPSEIVVATARQEVTVRAPRVGLALTLAAPDTPDSTTARVIYEGSTEAERYAYATVKPADGGTCAPSFGLDLGRSLLETESVSAAFAGRIEFSEAVAGSSYLICVWVQEGVKDVTAAAAAQTLVSFPPVSSENECASARGAVGRWARVVVARKKRHRAAHSQRKAARTKDGKRRISQRVKAVRTSLEAARIELESARDRVEEACA